MSTGTIQIPVLFDMSGDSVVYGEDATGADFVDSHLQFLLDMTTEANGISLNASDISSAILVADQDTGDNIFFDGDSKGIGIDNLCNRIAKAITRGKLVHVPSIGNFSNSGIPVGGEKYLYNNLGQVQDPGTYTLKYTDSIAPIGDEQMLGQAMARVASVHLIGDPLGSAAFQDATSIQTDLETTSSHTFNQGNTAFYNALAVQLSKVLGGSKSSAPMNPGILVGSDAVATPVDVTSANSTITGQTYTASSANHGMTHGTYGVQTAFNDVPSSGFWYTKTGTFNSGIATTNIVTGIHGYNNNSWSGIWLKIDLGQTVVLSEYKIHPRSGSAHAPMSPREGFFLSSLDGNNWFELHHLNLDATTGQALYHDGTNQHSIDTDLTGVNNREGRYFAFVVKKNFSSHYTSIGELQLFGVTKAEYDGGSPPAAYDVASSNSTLHKAPNSDNRVITAVNQYNTSYTPIEAFNNVVGSSASTGDAWISLSNTFSNGEVHTNFQNEKIASGVTGEWIQVDVGQLVYTPKFLVDSVWDQSNQYKAKDFTLYASKDGNTFYPIKSYTATTSEYYNATTGYSPIFIDVNSGNPPTDETDNRIARYFKLAITSTLGAGNHLRLQQFTLYGVKYPSQFGTAPAVSTTIYEPNVTPYDLTSTNSSLAGAATHVYSASSSNHGDTHGTYGVGVPFNNRLGNGTQMWFSKPNRYSSTNASGNYTGYQYTGDLSGEWIQIDLSENVLATYYTINGYRTSAHNVNIKKGYLLSSLDGTRWNLAHTLTVNSNDDWYNDATGANVQRHVIPNSDARKGKYWRFVINSTFGYNTHCYIDELQIFGAKYPSEVTEGNGALTTNSVSKYTLNVTPYDCTSSSSTGITGSIITGQTYSASSFTASRSVSNAFNNKYNTWWQSQYAYYNTVGDLSGSYYGMAVTEGYPGEWIQVDVGRLITATNCIIAGYQHTTQFSYSPHSGVILSSLDGKKWNFITEWTNGVENVAGETWYNNSGFRDKNIPLSGVHATARYFRMVLTKGNGVYSTVVLSNFKILGAKNPEEVTQGEHTITNSNIPLYVPTGSSYEIADRLTSPLAHRTEHIYTASSANHGFTHANYSLLPLFNYAQETNTNYWLSKPGYNSTDGTYAGSYYTGDLSGEWFQVDLSENVYVTKAIIMPYYHTTNFKNNVRKGYLLSSLDKKKWNLIHTYDDSSDDGSTVYSDDTIHPICLKITSSKNSIGRYFRFIVNKLYANSSAYAYVGKFRLYGVRYPSQVTEGDGATDTTTLISYTPTATPYEIHELQHSAQHIYSASETNHPDHANYGQQVPFNNNPKTANYWFPKTENFRYSAITGKYQGGTHTNDISGEWLQVDLSENILIRKYQVHPSWNTSHTDETVRKGSLLSSLDGLKWNLVDTFQNTDADGESYYVDSTFTYKERDVSGNHTIGKHFRFVVQETYSHAYPLIGQIRLFGVKHPSETSQGDIVIDISNNKPGYALNVSSYDVTSPDSILTGQTYSASTENHVGHTNYGVQVAFKNPVDGGSGSYWYPKASRYSSTGNYQAGITTVDSSGEWIQVDLSENVFIDHYHLNASYGNTTSHAKAGPKAGTLFSSLDGLKWEQVHTFDLSGDTVYYTDGNYRPLRYDITKTPNSIGRYFRFVVNKNFGDVNTLVRNLTIYGVKYPSQVTNTNILIEPALELNANWTTDQSLSFDVASSNSTLNGQTYTASSYNHGATHANYGIQNVFNGVPSASNYWIPYNTSTAGNMYSADGSYFGHKRSGNYYGAWVQVDVGQNVKITNYKIHPVPWTNANYNRNVKKGHLLSSLDGEKWNLVHTHNDTSTTTVTTTRSEAHSYDLYAPNITGRYFRFVIEETYGGIISSIGELEINGTLTTAEHYGSSFSTAERYNTFSIKDEVIPYDIYNKSLAHTTTPYVISTPVSSTVPIDIVSQNSTVSGQSYSATYGTAANAFDNSENTEWSTDASSNYGIISALITNEPNFTSWAAATDGVISTFSENITATTIDKSNFSIYDTSANIIVPLHSVVISNGKLLVKPLTGYQWNTNVAEYDLTSTSSTLYGTRGDITWSSQYNNSGHYWTKAFDTAINGPAVTASGSYSGGNPVGAPDTVVSGVTYNGHWVQLDVGQNVLVKTFEYTNRSEYQNNEWDTLLLAGSKDGTTWDLLWRETGRAQTTYSAKETYAVNATDIYSQFRWICEKNNGGVYAWNAMEMTLLGQKESEASLVAFNASKVNDYRITYTKPLNQDNQLKGVTNGVGLQSFVLEDGAVTGRGEFAILPLSLNEPSFTSSQVIGGGSPSWTERTVGDGTNSWRGIASSSDGTKVAAAAYSGNIWTSTDSGATWTSRATSKNWYSIASSSDGTKLAAVVYGANIWTSTDSGVTWTERTVGDGTNEWREITSSSDGTKLAAVASSSGNIWRSTDSGATWTSSGSPSKDWWAITSSSDGTKLAAVAMLSNIYTSTDSGATWTEVSNTSQNWRGIASSADGTKLVAVVREGHIFTSTDSGANWTQTSTGATQEWEGITGSDDGTKWYATYRNGNIYTSTDSGSTWTEGNSGAKQWRNITSSADGTKVFALVNSANIWTLAPTSPAQLEYTFSENLQAGAGGFDITDFQLIDPSGNTLDLSSNITGIVGGKLVIGTDPNPFNFQGSNYVLTGPNATHSGTLTYSWSSQADTTFHKGLNAFDGHTVPTNQGRWASTAVYSSGTYTGSVSTVTTNAGTINGEYIQADIGKLSILSHFTYFKSHDNTQDVTTGSVAGSIDGSTWTVITSFSYDKDNDPDEVTKNISTQTEYRYYRLIYAAVAGGSHAACGEWTLYGHVNDNYTIGAGISDVNYLLTYTKNSTVNKNIIGATNNVAINTFRIDNNILIGRGGVTNIGQYDGSTSTTLTDTSTYKGEYIQVDVGKNVIINNYAMNVKSVNGNDNPKSWMLVGSLNNSNWTKLDEKFNHTLTENYTATVTPTSVRYLRLIVNRGGAAKHIKISEFKVNGVTIRLEGQTYSASLDNGDANTVFDNSINTSWGTTSDYNYNELAALATNEPEFSSVSVHTDASGNGRLQLSFNVDLSSASIDTNNFSVQTLDLSSNENFLADISGGKLMFEKLGEIDGSIPGTYEDFDGQSFNHGTVTLAGFVSPGHGGTGYAIQGAKMNQHMNAPYNATSSSYYWRTETHYKAISFWVYIPGNQSVYDHPSYNGYGARDGGSVFFHAWHGGANSNYDVQLFQEHTRIGCLGADSYDTGGVRWIKYWINGVSRGRAARPDLPGAQNHTTLFNYWQHLYLEFNDDIVDTVFLASYNNKQVGYGDGSIIDKVRFFSKGITDAEIVKLSTGWDGKFSGASFPNTNYRIEYIKDASSNKHVKGDAQGVAVNNFIIQDGTLISRGTNHGIYRGSTTTTYNTNQTYNGEHINVNTGQETYITEYELHVPAPPNANVGNNIYPKSWILLGSTNGSDWTKIHEVSDYTGWTTNSSYGQGFQVKYSAEIANIVAQHYRLIINKTFGKVGYTSVAELLIKGVKHTSETTGLTQVKTASLGTAANAFDGNITTDWNTSSSATYSLIATAATNEPTFSSIAVNSGKLEVTFSENVAVTGSLDGNDFNITDSGTRIYVTPTIANNKLSLEYLGIPASQIYHESFDDEDVTFHANADIVYVAGRGGGKAMSTIGQSPSGFQWIQKVSDSSLPASVRAVSFQIKVTSGEYIFDNRQTSGSVTDNRAMFFSSGNLRFWNNSNTSGAASGSGYLPTGNQPTIWYDGVKQVYNNDNNHSNGATIMSDSGTVLTLTLINDGNWHHFYIEYPDGEGPTDFTWFSRYGASNYLEATMDDLRYYNAPLLQANIASLAAGGAGGLTGSFTHTNLDITYTKNATAAKNIVNAAHTTVPVSSFFISNSVEMSRGETGKGDYRGTTSTTYNTNKTYTGEYVQIDMGQNILMTEYKLHIPYIAHSNPKNWKLLYSSNGTDWTEAHDISNNTSWANSTLISNSSYGSGSVFNASTLTNNFIGRYFRLVVNKVTGPSNHVKIGELQIKGVMHTMETVSDNNPTPVAATATPSDNTTTVTDSTVTSTTHLNNDTTTTTTTETRIVIAANTETTTTKKTNVQIVTTATPHFGLTATASNTVTTHSDNTVTSTTYANNDTTTRTLVTKTVDISANTNTSTNYNTIITKIINAFAVSTGSGSAFNPNKVYDASGVACPALKSIYEQLMNVPGRSQIMQSRDFTSSPMPSVSTITGGFPFIPGDKLVMYLRPKIVFAQATFPEQFTNLLGFGGVTFGEPTVDTALASGGAISGQTYTQSSKYSDTYAGSKLFDGSTTSFWITASDTYDASGIATGGSTTIHADDGGGTYTGHYVQIQFANSVAIEDIKITPRYGGGGGAGEPKEFRILSSDDGSTFRVAYSVAEGDLNNDWSLWSTQAFHLPNLRNASSKGKYWRIAVGKITTGNKVQLAKVELIGNLTSTLIGNDIGAPIVTGGGSGPDLASQIYHEDFQDQSYDGTVTGAPVVSVIGHTGQTTYVVETKISGTERWEQTGYSTAKTFSFWHKYIAGGKTSGTYIFEKLINGGYIAIYYTTSNSTLNFEGYNTANSTFYLNGVAQNSNGSISHDATQWTHYCFVFNDTHATSKINWGHPGRGYEAQTQYHTNGYFDDVRIFNEELTAFQIADLAAGENGNSGKNHPYDIASSNSTLSGQTYTASSTYREADYAASEAFDNSWTVPNDSWVTGNNKYSNGIYAGSEYTDGYAGEWVQVDIGQEAVLKSFEIHPRYSQTSDHAPKNMRLFSSADGTNWSQVYDWVGLTSDDWGGSFVQASNAKSVGPYTTNTTGRYFRLVINEGIGNTAYCQISELVLKGLTAAQEAANQALARGDPITTTYPTSTLTNGYATTGSILDISGLETNITKLSSTFPALFPGNTTGGPEAEPEKFGWVGSANADTLSLETTDEKDTRTMDLHIWKITITL